MKKTQEHEVFSMLGKEETLERSGMYNLNPKTIVLVHAQRTVTAQREGTEMWALFQSQVI